MRPVRLSDLTSLVSQPEFQGWWSQLQAAHEALARSRERHHALLREAALTGFNAELAQKTAIDTLYRAGETEDAAATLNFEANEAENSAFQLVSQFEDLRIHVSDLWYRLGALEKSMEEKQEEASRPGAGRKAEESLRAVVRAHQACNEEYERLAERKRELWERVEALWGRQAETSLKMAELKVRGRRIRKDAEEGFQRAEKLKLETEKTRAAAEAASNEVSAARTTIDRLLHEATERFGCAAGEDFLYFRQKDNQRWAYCLALVNDTDSYNVEVKPLSVYSVEQKRGATFLEPARERPASTEEGDRRFEEYFLMGRKGRPPAMGA
jgi:hypothetical protein